MGASSEAPNSNDILKNNLNNSIQAAIALGSNLGHSEQILTNAITVIDQRPGVHVSARSHFYKTAPVGPPQPDYINACITVETNLSARALLQRLLSIEGQFGRIRKERWGARSLDLDLIFYGDRIIDAPKLSVPHPRLHERAFVLIPLMDIAPQWQHPVMKRTVKQLTEQLSDQNLLTGVERLVSYKSQTV
ncbi:MAG: 2-amino-4-hydroxy-6-hydroxymethyldihydropteridine diphosphokinase [Cyanobacteria bacterium J06621_11]